MALRFTGRRCPHFNRRTYERKTKMIFKLLMIGVALLVAGAISLEAAPELPVVTIEAIDAVGSEDGDTITFRLSRKGDTTTELEAPDVFSRASRFGSLPHDNF